MPFVMGLTGWLCAATSQTASAIWYSSPLFNAADPVGTRMSSAIDVELRKLMGENKLKRLKKLPYDADTAFLRMYQKNLLQRNTDGYVNYASVQHAIQSFNLPISRFLLIYDMTGYKSGANITYDFSEKHPMLAAGPAWQFASQAISNINLNDIDSIRCKASMIDFNTIELQANYTINATSKTCDAYPLDCVTESLLKFDRSNGAQVNKDDLFKGASHDTHWGKIWGGSILLTGGIAVCILGATAHNVSPGAYILGGAMAIGGGTLLSIGIIRQKNESK